MPYETFQYSQLFMILTIMVVLRTHYVVFCDKFTYFQPKTLKNIRKIDNENRFHRFYRIKLISQIISLDFKLQRSTSTVRIIYSKQIHLTHK